MSDDDRDHHRSQEAGLLLHRALYVLEQMCTCSLPTCTHCKLAGDIEAFFQRNQDADAADNRRAAARDGQ